MRIPRIFIDQNLAEGQQYPLSGSAAHHITHVLRMKAGQSLALFNGKGGQFVAEIRSISKKGVDVVTHQHHREDRESHLQITLAQGISRGERMDYTLQKAVELGVARIVPVLCDYTNVKLDDARISKRHEHWRNIIINACEQCGRNRLPELLPVQDFDKWISDEQRGLKLILHPVAAKTLGQLRPLQQAITLLAGPEGGFSDNEVSLSVKYEYQPVILGPRILRTETAALAAISACQTLWGDFN